MAEKKTSTCNRHGETVFALYANRWRCLQCEAENKRKRRHKVQDIIHKAVGESCVLCGYSKCRRALHFHHLVPEDKSFGLSDSGWMKGVNVLLKEAKKCIVLCSNCHMEVEAGITEIPEELTIPGRLVVG
jgi:hypothetical protein